MFGKRKETSQYKRLIAKNKELRERIVDLEGALNHYERDKKALEREIFRYKIKYGEVGPDKPQRNGRIRPPVR